MQDKIVIHGARAHNLKNIDVEIPRDKLVVVTGLSGSGKSSFMYEILYKNLPLRFRLIEARFDQKRDRFGRPIFS